MDILVLRIEMKSIYKPGQSFILQSFLSLGESQVFPPYFDSIRIRLERLVDPFPHVTLHVLQSPQSDILQSTRYYMEVRHERIY